MNRRRSLPRDAREISATSALWPGLSSESLLIEEKFVNFLQAAETDADFRAEIPAFLAEIKTVFEPWQLRECLERARETEPFSPDDYEGEDPETIEMERKEDIRRCTADLLTVERAREWLLEEE
jgi:hypothetical protein